MKKCIMVVTYIVYTSGWLFANDSSDAGVQDLC